MASRILSRAFISPVLGINFILYLIVLGIAGWALDTIMVGPGPLMGNAATFNFTIFSLIAGAVGIASIIVGFHLIRDWRTDSVASTAASATIAWVLTLVAFGLAWKEIDISDRGTTLKFLETFVIIVTITQLFYLLLLHASLFRSI